MKGGRRGWISANGAEEQLEGLKGEDEVRGVGRLELMIGEGEVEKEDIALPFTPF